MSGSLPAFDFDSPRPRRGSDPKRLTVGRLLLFVGALVLITLASVPPRPSPERLRDEQVGEPASRTVLAPFPLKVVNQRETEKLRREAEEKVPPTYSRQSEVVGQARKQWRALIQLAQEENRPLPAGGTLSEATETAHRLWKGLPRSEQEILRRKLLDPAWRETVLAKITKALEEGEILGKIRNVEAEPQSSRSTVLWRLKEPDGALKDHVSWVSVSSVTQQQEYWSKNLLESDFGGEEKAKTVATALAKAFVKPTIEIDKEATDVERHAARAGIHSVSVEFKQNQKIVARGEIVTDDQKQALLELRTRMESRLGEFLGRTVLIFGILLVLFGFLKRSQPDLYQDLPRLAAFLGELTLVSWSGFIVAWGVEFDALRATESSISQVGLVVPVAAAGMLAALLENASLGPIAVLISTLLLGIQFNWGFEVLLVLALSGILSVYHVTGISRRSQVYLAWPWILGSGVVLLFGIHMVLYPSWQAFSHYYSSLLWGCLWIGINGLLSVGISLLLLPILEDMLGITTEFKLREISSYHPLLRQLEEKAPGTYYHSLNVSALAESAAAAIGANAVLVKVAAYYHDIGKMEKPGYFAENQFTEEDRRKHSKISPHMSCLIIRNHVKLGIEMARDNGLPEAILPFIAEHHGTTLLSYFYDQARSEDPHGTVSEMDFRYPGPKPQTIESALLMLADSIEAASRSMKLVGEGEIRVFVKRIINDKMVDGQFDECNLTFRQLRILSESFTRTLRTMMHRRIAYPSMPEVDLSGNGGKAEKVQPLFRRGS
jgi:hypothetical protein